ncbi:MAG: C40 family peptidase [Bacteroidota bacterium]
MNLSLRAFIALLPVLFVSCTTKNKGNIPLDIHISAVQSKFAPDKRVALFQVDASEVGGMCILRGESNLPKAVAELKERLDREKINFVDSIQILPSQELQGNTQAVVTLSVANLRGNPKHSAELATQATLGTPVKVLKKKGSWYYIQTPDNYLSWVDAGGIELMDNERFEQWQGTDKLIYTQTYGHAFLGEDEKERVSDLVAGNVLEVLKYTAKHVVVRFPDGRKALVRNEETERYADWVKSLDPTVDDLVFTSQALMGVPYLWGGTSTKGMDCSGFTKTIYFLNGMVIPRDASQQVHTGKPIDSVQNFDALQKGDLLFFGTKATDSTQEKVVHVGMWIGNNEFIHASERIRIGSMDPKADNFDAWNHDRYLRTKRILKQKDKGLIRLMDTPLFKD